MKPEKVIVGGCPPPTIELCLTAREASCRVLKCIRIFCNMHSILWKGMHYTDEHASKDITEPVDAVLCNPLSYTCLIAEFYGFNCNPLNLKDSDLLVYDLSRVMGVDEHRDRFFCTAVLYLVRDFAGRNWGPAEIGQGLRNSDTGWSSLSKSTISGVKTKVLQYFIHSALYSISHLPGVCIVCLMSP